MSFLAGLERGWISIQLPGTGPPPRPGATYVLYRYGELPAVPGDLGSWEWLRRSARHVDSTLARPADHATRDLSAEHVAELMPRPQQLPEDVVSFLADPGLREHLRSATDCYFDLGHHRVPVDGGYLLHLLSDSQWVRHWLLFVGEETGSAVVTTRYPTGFQLSAEESDYWTTEPWEYRMCAPSFAEFTWRWWMDNDIFYALQAEHEELTPQQREYLRGYGHPPDSNRT